jgi:choline dehydrogenase-like flavoprotein
MYDVCIIGSGAGAGPIAYELALNGQKVVILEKGDWYKREDFSKDEIAYTKRDIVTPNLKDEFHTIVKNNDEYTTEELEWSFWNGSLVGGASNFMSGFFHKLHKDDFQLNQKNLEINNANIVDWPITFEELNPYYRKVDNIVGVTNDTKEHPISKYIDQSCQKLNLKSEVTARAILSQNRDDRNECYYSNYCGSYGCSSGAKGSSREALLNPALKTGNLTILSNCHVTKLVEKNNQISEVIYIDKKTKNEKKLKSKIFVIACQAIESSRLLLNSKSTNYPNGLGNNYNQVGKNLLFSAGGLVNATFNNSLFKNDELMVEGLFVNRTVKDFYFLDNNKKGGILEFTFEHANPIKKANQYKWENGKLLWGEKLYEKLYSKFNYEKKLQIEIFNDWIPHDGCYVTLDNEKKDKYGMPVAKIFINAHPYNQEIAETLSNEAFKIFKEMGATNITSNISSYPPVNLQAGGCRFGMDEKTSVLDKNCRVHSIENLFVSDGSFMPTGGSVPYTYTIYANSFRIADYLKEKF